jgi:nitrate/TMAO reductase-like tetraheme cytochrome c subunit
VNQPDLPDPAPPSPGEPDPAGQVGDVGTSGEVDVSGATPAAVDLRDIGTPGEVRATGPIALVGRAVGRLFGQIPHPPLRSRRGLFLLIVLVAGIGSAVTVGSVAAIQWTETAAFCGQCHTMGPELKAYEASPHRNVACVECHTEPGVAGWIKAKLNGTRQLVQILTGTYPKPIPAPDHDALPPTSVTCLKCHDVAPLVANGGPIKLVLHDSYQSDEAVTRDSIALVLRPFGFGGSSDPRGVHWHIASDVEYLAADEHAQKIDYVAVTEDDGSKDEFLAASAVTMTNAVGPDIARLRANDRARTMDCIDCHNRIGHEIEGLDQAIDDQLDAGTVSRTLPFIKREASDRLSVEYASQAEADRAIDGLRDFYTARYPLIASDRAADINGAIAGLKTVYRLVATPDMRVTAATYPDNLGHQTAPGCFRCHDGAHYKVVGGALTNETIPSQCSTCHTFPQIGQTESGVLIGQRPDTHNDRLWVFNHKTRVTSADPTGQSCGACHTATYCENCHATSAVKVSHDSMVTSHASVTRQIGAAACASCHQPAYCAQCHSNRVLPEGPAGLGESGPAADEDRPASMPP